MFTGVAGSRQEKQELCNVPVNSVPVSSSPEIPFLAPFPTEDDHLVVSRRRHEPLP